MENNASLSKTVRNNSGIEEFAECALKSEISACISNNTALSDDRSSSWNAESDVSCDTQAFNDPFEGVLYRTHVYESKLNISFMCNVFFETFTQKIHSDYMSSVDIDETSFISKCTTHVKGAKCDIKLDSHFKTVELSGIGFKKWREERFPKIAQALFKRLMDELDSQTENSSRSEAIQEEQSDYSLEQENLIDGTTTCLKNDVDVGAPIHDVAPAEVAPSGSDERMNVKQNGASQNSVDPESKMISSSDQQGSYPVVPPEFIAENINRSYFQSANSVANCSEIDKDCRQEINDDRLQTSTVNHGVFPGHDQVRRSMTMPVFTSTPIIQRQDGVTVDKNACNRENINSIINRIDQLDSGIRTIKMDILQQMEWKMNELKASLVSILEILGQNMSCGNAVNSSNTFENGFQHSSEVSQVTLNSCFIDEGSKTSNQGSTSETHLKMVVTRENRPLQIGSTAVTTQQKDPAPTQQNVPVTAQHNVPATIRQNVAVPTFQNVQATTVPQNVPVPVRITKRNQPSKRLPMRNNFDTAPQRSNGNLSFAKPKRTLLIGDSILKGVNTKGLTSDVKICAKGGATVNDLLDELSVYDLKSFAQVIIYIGENDCSNRMDTHAFEEKYDQLISLIKSANKDCIIYLSKIAPRGDVDVTVFNTSITRIVAHWARHQVKCIHDSHDLFFGRNGLPSNRYYSHDGVHLSHSGTKRLLDSLNRHVNIVKDFNQCIFRAAKFQQNAKRPGTSGISYPDRQYHHNDRELGNNGRRRHSRVCYGCYLPGHIASECWYEQ